MATGNLENHIEALLFLKGEPISSAHLAKLLNVSKEEVEVSLGVLEEKMKEKGVILVRKDDLVALASSPESAEFTQALAKEEISSQIGKAGAEVLAVVLYKGPVKRTDIDFLRGVNSSYILRNLAIRGLVEREVNEKDNRSFVYKPSFQLLQYLGVGNIKDLPDFESFNQKIEEFVKEQEEQVKLQEEQLAQE